MKCGQPLVAVAAATSSGAHSPASAPDTEPTFIFTQLGSCDCGEAKIKTNGTCKACGRLRIVKCQLCDEGVDKINPDGCCECGNRRIPKPADYNEIVPGPQFASVSDRCRHVMQQDYHALFVTPGALIFGDFDGVSGSSKGGEAAEAAGKAAISTLASNLSNSMPPDQNLIDAIREAQRAVLEVPWTKQSEDDQPPCTTILVAIKIGTELHWGWLGDTRLGWVTDTAGEWLVTDDSWINSQRTSGVSEEIIQATIKEKPKLARAVVRCLGWLAGEPSTLLPNIGSRSIPAGSMLIGCTDGFHVFADSPEKLASVVRQHKGASALHTARNLVNWAKTVMNGRDNITVTVLTD